MPPHSLTVREIFTNIADAFIGTLEDMYHPTDPPTDQSSGNIKSIQRENRYMYLSMLVLLIVLLNALFTTR